MYRAWEKALSLFLCLVMCFSLLPVSAFADKEAAADDNNVTAEAVEVAEEQPPLEYTQTEEKTRDVIPPGEPCGDDLTWTLADGTLTISGTGRMYDYKDVEDEYDWAPLAPWYDCIADITSLSIGSGVTYIGAFAFKNCYELKCVVIPGNVKEIGTGAFWSCALTDVTIGSGTEIVGACAFYSCGALSSVTLPGSVNLIGNGAFYDCISLTDITIPEGVTVIANSTFRTCRNLASVRLPISLEKIEDSAFYDCTGLQNIYYPGTSEQWAAIKIIGDYNAPLYSAAVNTQVTEGPEQDTAVIDQASVIFDGLLRLKYYLILPDPLKDSSSCFIVFYNNGEETRRLPLSDGITGSDGKTVFYYDVVAKAIDNDVTMKLVDDTGGLIPMSGTSGTDYTESGATLSVGTYARRMMTDGETDNMRALAGALNDYGIAAGRYFGIANDGALSAETVAVTEETLKDYEVVITGEKPEGISQVTLTVMFEADNALRLYYAYKEGFGPEGYTYLVDGQPAELRQRQTDGSYYLTVPNIAAKKLDEAHTFTVSDGTSTYSFSTSVLSYARLLIHTENDNSSNLGKALYVYNIKAEAYFGE